MPTISVQLFLVCFTVTVLLILFNPLMPRKYFCNCIKFIVFKKQMLQAANTDLSNPLVPKARNSERQNLLFHLQIKSVKVILKLIGRFLFFAPSRGCKGLARGSCRGLGTNGLTNS